MLRSDFHEIANASLTLSHFCSLYIHTYIHTHTHTHTHIQTHIHTPQPGIQFTSVFKLLQMFKKATDDSVECKTKFGTRVARWCIHLCTIVM